MFSISFRKYHDAKKKINLFTLIIKMYIILFGHTIITSTAYASLCFYQVIETRF